MWKYEDVKNVEMDVEKYFFEPVCRIRIELLLRRTLQLQQRC